MIPALLSGPHPARVTRVVDGDTIRCDIRAGDLLLGTERLEVWAMDRPVRLLGCNAAEVRTDAGKAAREHLRGMLPEGTPVVLDLVDDYKYGGELVAGVWLAGADLVAYLIQQQWAAPWNGRGPMPLPPWPRTVEDT